MTFEAFYKVFTKYWASKGPMLNLASTRTLYFLFAVSEVKKWACCMCQEVTPSPFVLLAQSSIMTLASHICTHVTLRNFMYSCGFRLLLCVFTSMHFVLLCPLSPLLSYLWTSLLSLPLYHLHADLPSKFNHMGSSIQGPNKLRIKTLEIWKSAN